MNIDNEYLKSLKQQYTDRLKALHSFIYEELPIKIMNEAENQVFFINLSIQRWSPIYLKNCMN